MNLQRRQLLALAASASIALPLRARAQSLRTDAGGQPLNTPPRQPKVWGGGCPLLPRALLDVVNRSSSYATCILEQQCRWPPSAASLQFGTARSHTATAFAASTARSEVDPVFPAPGRGRVLSAASVLVAGSSCLYDAWACRTPRDAAASLQGGAQAAALRQQLLAMPATGHLVLTVPKAPYRCPPGPYERAFALADGCAEMGARRTYSMPTPTSGTVALLLIGVLRSVRGHHRLPRQCRDLFGRSCAGHAVHQPRRSAARS